MSNKIILSALIVACSIIVSCSKDEQPAKKRGFSTFGTISTSLIADNSSFPVDPNQKCYIHLTCTGKTSVMYEWPETYRDLLEMNLPYAGRKFPEINMLRMNFKDRMVTFDRICNKRRYAHTTLTPGDEWDSDAREMYVKAAKTCITGCAKKAEPCVAKSDCCSGLSCNTTLGVCYDPLSPINDNAIEAEIQALN